TRLKVAAGRVTMLEATLRARVGDWVTVEVPDASAIAELLAERSEEYAEVLSALGGAPAAAAAPVMLAPEVIAPAAPPPPEPEPEPEPEEEEEEDDGSPPKSPTLDKNQVVFARKKDLAHELETNLANGGLFVDASPLPIRAHRSMNVIVGKRDTGVVIEADVVFASGGKVGFSVGSFNKVVSGL
ncbi:MAG: hypothetical protein KC420_23085, partial [Myxococcales bacterium]|nr:hypothetical protein [Myxococcales bacterium]